MSPSSAFRRLLGVVVLHSGVVLPGCASLRPSGRVTFPGVVFGSSFVIEVVLLALVHQGVAVVFTPCVAESVLRRVLFGGARVVSSHWCHCVHCALSVFSNASCFVPQGLGPTWPVALFQACGFWRVAFARCACARAFRFCAVWSPGALCCTLVALSVVHQALVVASVPVFPLACGASVCDCGTLLRRWRSLLSIRPVTVRSIGLLVLDQVVCRCCEMLSFGLTSDVFCASVTVCHIVEHVTLSFCGSGCIWCPCPTTRKVWVRPSGDSGCRFRVLRVLRVCLLSLLDREEATEWVADWLVLTARSVGGCSRVVFGWRFPLFGPDLASLGTYGVVVPCVSTACRVVATPVGGVFLSRSVDPQRFDVVLVVLPRMFTRCLALEGLSRSEVVSIFWDPHPREPVEGEPRSGARREVAAWPGYGVACVVCFYGGSISPFSGVEAGARLHCGCSLAVASSRGRRWSGLVRTGASGGFRSMFLRFRGSVPWCLSVVAPVGVVLDLVRIQGLGGSTCGPLTRWRCAEHCFRFVPDSVVPAALAGEGPVIPTRPCSRGSPPLLLSARGSSSRELGVRRVAEVAVAPCVVSSSKSECSKHIVNKTMLSVRASSINLKIQQLPQPWLKALKDNGNNLLQQKIFFPTVVKWMHPPIVRIKLNVDGAFKSATGIAGGRGILRDHNGDCIFAFAANYQRTTSALDAEARALQDGLAMCCTKGFLDIMVETDSLALTQSVTSQALRL
ncbi:hypothetical protein Taro_006663 [Colocasia esculenta]|uniref:RNase H type-1 domain-containing protein n=1 Tax=Colocasia esculenta TaxID=4460 RepID=A0A843TPB6_COLES|nr:hypothetical protein [Colocasia esculenta]